MNNELVTVANGIPVVSSREVAEHFEKRHDHVVRDIGRYEKDVPNFGEMFIESTEPDTYGRNQRVYLLTRDGFSLVVMGFTGQKALEWKLRYIEAFNKMEAQLKQTDQRAPLLLEIYKGGQSAVVAARTLTDLEKAPLLAQIEEQKPLVEFAAHVSQSADTIDIGALSKMAKDEHIDIGRNRLFQYLREKGILMGSNLPYQRYMENGWFEVAEVVKHTPYGDKLFTKPVVTGKGQIRIIEMLRKDIGVTGDAIA